MTTAAELFKALSDATRQQLLQLLTTQELSVSELVEVLRQPQSTVSRHLKVLHEAGLLVDRRVGAAVRYSAVPPAVIEGETGVGKASQAGNGIHVSLRDRLLDWARQEPLDGGVRARLEGALRRRQGSPTDFFEAVGSRWDQMRVESFGEVFHFEALVALLPRKWTVADIGTGTGYLLPVLAKQFRKVIAVDPAERMLALARRRVEQLEHGEVEFRRGSLAKLPLGDGEVDLAIASLVLHHVPEPDRALVEIRRCLKKGGQALIIEQSDHDDAVFQERTGDLWRGFGPGVLEGWLRGAGFVDVETRPLSTARAASRTLGKSPELKVVRARVGRQGLPSKAPRIG